MSSPEQRPKVGIGVMILKDGKVLLGKRKNAHGEGQYAFPGGHLEFQETFEECAIRETREEAGIEIENIRFARIANIFFGSDKHYVDIGIVADWKSGEPIVLEPEKSESWGWYDLDALPEPQFPLCPLTVKSYQTGQVYFGTIK